MRISAKSEYGVRAMVMLARRHGEGPVPLSLVAEQERISVDFLEQLMLNLRRRGLVRSVRGIRGGYLLALAPTEISVGDVMRAVEGPVVNMPCLDHAEGGDPCCSMGMHVAECTTRDVWALLQEKINQTLNGISLRDLCQQQGLPVPATPALLRELSLVSP